MSTKAQRVLQAVNGQVWAIQPGKLQEISAVVARRFIGEPKLDAEEVLAMTRAKTPASRSGTVAVLPLHGVIAQRMDMLTAMSGGTSTEQFAAAFDEAVADEGVSAIVIDINSPGGSVSGVPELAARIRAARGTKPVVAVANSLMCSAAYWIGSAADSITATEMSFVASCNAIMVRVDTSEADAKEGVRYHFITGGPTDNKAEGHPEFPASEEELAEIQANVDVAYEAFMQAIAANRGLSLAQAKDLCGQGRAFIAPRALDLKLVDAIGTLDSVLASLGAKGARPRMRAEAETVDLAAMTEPVISAGALDELFSVTPSVIKLVTDNAGLAAINPPSTNQPAHKAKEQTVEDTNTAAINEAALVAERKRVSDLYALASEHEMPVATAQAWVDGGVSIGAASAEILRKQKDTRAAGDTIRVGTDRATTQPFESFGAFAHAVYKANPNVGGVTDPRLLGAAQGMQQAIPSEGGFMVPPSFSSTIWDGLAADESNLLALTDNYTVEGESLTFNANAETSRANGSRFGGVQGYWIAEADQITKSKPKFRQMKLEPHQLAVLIYATDKLLANSPAALEQYLTRAATEEIAFKVGDAIVNGTGAGQPVGLLGAASTISVAKETSQVAATFVKANANKMWARLHPRSRKNAVWLVNVDVEPQFDEFHSLVKNVAGTENVGGLGSQIYNAEKNTLKGRPVIACEFAQTLGTKGDVMLVDLGAYATGTRGGVSSAMSIHLRFDYLESAFRFVFEVDGQPWLASALTPFKGSNTLSTQVVLDTRA